MGNKVMLVHNEHIVEEQPACGKALCSVADFKAYYQHIVDFDWDTECPMPVPENDYNDYTDSDVAGVGTEDTGSLDNCGKDGKTVICGDKCISQYADCQCGSEKFRPQETDQHCCLPSGGSCTQAGAWGDTVCPQGVALSKSTQCGNTATEVVNVVNEKNNTEVINVINVINIYPQGSTTEANSEDGDCECDDDESDEDSDEDDSSEEEDSSEGDSSEEEKDKKHKKCDKKKCHKNKSSEEED